MTVREGFLQAKQALSEEEARILMEELFGWGRLALSELAQQPLTAEQEQRLQTALQQRANGVPLQYIIGHWWFMDRDYAVGEGVLIPRDDTEVAVRQALSFLHPIAAPKVTDLCAGSGIIALTIAQERPDAAVTAVEKEPAALTYLHRNNQAYGSPVTVLPGDIFTCHTDIQDASLDLLVANPPYIRTALLPTLQREVQREPMTALDGGQDGLAFYRCIAADWTRKLKPGGGIVLEIGEEQADAVTALLAVSGIGHLQTLQDIQGLDRVIFGTMKP